MAEPRRENLRNLDEVRGARVLIVEARFYHDIADALLAGAVRALERAGASFEKISVPGPLTWPAIAIAMQRGSCPIWRGGDRCVIEGRENSHYDIVPASPPRLMDLSVARRFPRHGIILSRERGASVGAGQYGELDKAAGSGRAR